MQLAMPRKAPGPSLRAPDVSSIFAVKPHSQAGAIGYLQQHSRATQSSQLKNQPVPSCVTQWFRVDQEFVVQFPVGTGLSCELNQ